MIMKRLEWQRKQRLFREMKWKEKLLGYKTRSFFKQWELYAVIILASFHYLVTGITGFIITWLAFIAGMLITRHLYD